MSYVFLSLAIGFGVVIGTWLNAVTSYLIALYLWKKNGPKQKAQEAELNKFLDEMSAQGSLGITGGSLPSSPYKGRLN